MPAAISEEELGIPRQQTHLCLVLRVTRTGACTRPHCGWSIVRGHSYKVSDMRFQVSLTVIRHQSALYY
jgi:hypothetical protein